MNRFLGKSCVFEFNPLYKSSWLTSYLFLAIHTFFFSKCEERNTTSWFLNGHDQIKVAFKMNKEDNQF